MHPFTPTFRRARPRRAALIAIVATLTSAVGVLATPTFSAAAQDSAPPPSARQMVSAVPSAVPPTITGGSVQSIAQVGSQMIVAGPITAVGGVARDQVAAFDTTTGAVTPGFAPAFNGLVQTVLPGPTPGTVYVGGKFTTVNGAKASRVALLDTTTGALVKTFVAPAINGLVNDLYRVGDRLYVAGVFTTVGGVRHAGLASLQASTGKLDPFMGVNLTLRHNDGIAGTSVGPVGASALDVSPDGRTMVVIGNFKLADGMDRQQAVMIDVSGATASVRADWHTRRYEPLCFNWAYDTYVRGVSFSPDGSYFVIAATGGANNGSLCDSIARWETSTTGADVQPTWVNFSGGDTLWATTVTQNAIYVGGHQRWLNNSEGNDFAATGAVPRAGLAALDPLSGRPLAWNPGRNPRGVAVYSLLATSQGLWVGSNTDWIGNRKYKRPKLAFFPYTGGATLAATTTPTLPGSLFLGGKAPVSGATVLYRVNAGGPAIPAVDGGPVWADDSGDTSPYRTSGSNAAGWDPVSRLDASVPSSTPSTVFSSERWDPAGGDELQWHFPVPAGRTVQVRLYFANQCGCTSAPGQRTFDVDIDGTRRSSALDLSGTYGDRTGVMIPTTVVSDGVVDISLGHEIENPLINAIEIVATESSTPADATLRARSFDGSTAGAPTSTTSSIDWSTVRGTVTIGDQLFYGSADGQLRRAPLSGTTVGTPTVLQPYHDPLWMTVKTGTGTSVYDGHDPDLAGVMSRVGGMFYSGGRLYYTLDGSPTLNWVWFSPDSGIVDGRAGTAPSSVGFAGVTGTVLSGNDLYYVTALGDLMRVTFSGGAVTGTPTLVDGPSTGGTDWRGRALFAGTGR